MLVRARTAAARHITMAKIDKQPSDRLLARSWMDNAQWLRGWVFSGFGWNGLGVALHTNWPLIQIAEFTGVAGLSFLVVFANVTILTTGYRLILEARTRVMRPHFDFTVTMAAIVGVLVFGLRATQVSPPAKPLRVAAVQSNVPQHQKFDPQFTRKIFDQFRRLSEISLRQIRRRNYWFGRKADARASADNQES